MSGAIPPLPPGPGGTPGGMAAGERALATVALSQLPDRLMMLARAIAVGGTVVAASGNGTVVLRSQFGEIVLTTPVDLPVGHVVTLQIPAGNPPTTALVFAARPDGHAVSAPAPGLQTGSGPKAPVAGPPAPEPSPSPAGSDTPAAPVELPILQPGDMVTARLLAAVPPLAIETAGAATTAPAAAPEPQSTPTTGLPVTTSVPAGAAGAVQAALPADAQTALRLAGETALLALRLPGLAQVLSTLGDSPTSQVPAASTADPFTAADAGLPLAGTPPAPPSAARATLSPDPGSPQAAAPPAGASAQPPPAASMDVPARSPPPATPVVISANTGPVDASPANTASANTAPADIMPPGITQPGTAPPGAPPAAGPPPPTTAAQDTTAAPDTAAPGAPSAPQLPEAVITAVPSPLAAALAGAIAEGGAVATLAAAALRQYAPRRTGAGDPAAADEADLHVRLLDPEAEGAPQHAGAATLPARVLGTGVEGRTILETPLGPMALAGRLPAPPGTRLALVLPEPSDAPTAAAAPETPAGGLTRSLAHLAEAQPALARAIAADLIPQPGPRLTTQIAAFIEAAKAGDAAHWIGREGAGMLTRLGPAHEAGRLADAVSGAIQPRVAMTDARTWWSITVPFAANGVIVPLTIRVRHQEDDGGSDGQAGAGPRTTRFQIDLELSRLGPLQLDGLSRARRLDIVLRSRQTLDLRMRQELSGLYTDTVGAMGLSGSLQFQTGMHGWIVPAAGRGGLDA